MKKGRKIATRNKLSIYYSDDNWYSVFTSDGKCLGKGYYCFANAERFCLNVKHLQSSTNTETESEDKK